jgi:hypothetical protein
MPLSSLTHSILDCHAAPKCLLGLLAKERLLVLLAKKRLDLVTQAFLLLMWLLFLLGGSSTVASVFFLVDVAFAAALDVAVSQSD